MEPVRRFRRADELTSGRALAGWLSIDGEPKGVDEMKIPGRNGSWRRPQARRRGRLQVRLQVRLQSASSPPPVHFRPGRARLHLYLRAHLVLKVHGAVPRINQNPRKTAFKSGVAEARADAGWPRR
jgi:hypothetical protein